MSSSSDHETDDPATLAAVAKMRRVSMIATGVMFAGVGLVLAVIAYRLMTVRPPAGPARSGVLELEAGRVVSAVAADGMLTVTYEKEGAPVIVIYDLATLKPAHRLTMAAPGRP